MKKRSIFTCAIAASLCLALLGGCGSGEEPDVQEETGYWETQQFDAFSGEEFTEVGKSGKMQLLLNPSTGVVRWLDTSTGVYQDTNMIHNEGRSGATNAEKSDVVVRFFAGSTTANQLYNTTNAYDSFSMCVDRNQLSYQKIENGVRVLYTMGDDSVTWKNFPSEISDERMQEYVVQHLDSIQYSVLEKRYSKLKSGKWIRMFNDTSRITKAATQELYELFYVVGTYTEELLIEDLDAAGTKAEDYPSSLSVKIPVDYYLDGEELIVQVDTTKIETDAQHPVNQIELLPYFLTSDPAIESEDGYMFVPDGSGALIYLDSAKTREYHFAGAFYGGDKVVNATSSSGVDNKLMLPVFGMKSSSSTIFGVIEEGAEVALMDAYVSGTDNSQPYSKIKLTFDIQTQHAMASGAKNANGNYTLYRVSDDVYDENITLRYFWLGKDAGYVEMANCYADYLTEKGVLSDTVQESAAPFYVELLGATDKTKYMLGIPYEGTQTLTTFSQAEEILRDLTEVGVQNVKLVYSGMVNGGMNQRSLVSGVKFAPDLGGKSGFNSLKKYAESVGAQIFPNLQLQTVHTKTKVSNSMAAWNILNERAQIHSFDPVKKTVVEDEDYPLYPVDPNYMETYLNKVKKSYSSRTGLDTIASQDLFTFILTNYRGTHASPSTGLDLMGNAVAGLTEGMTLMLSNPVSEAYAYCTYLTDIPMEDSGMRVLDASVPFVGLVLDGHMVYSSESLNRESTDVYQNFMRVLESNGAPKFTFMYESSSLLVGTEQENYFAVDYSYWKDKIGAYYEEYRSFYDQVKGATITDHELYERNDKLRVVTYSNGVKVYFNYSDSEERIGGVTVPAFSYVIK